MGVCVCIEGEVGVRKTGNVAELARVQRRDVCTSPYVAGCCFEARRAT